jgi:hypothetical protein
MNFLQITQSIAFISLCYAAVVLAKHWARVQQVIKLRLNLPVLNLKGKGFAQAEKAYFEDLRGLLQDGY